MSTILKSNPNLHGVLFDLPHAIESAKRLFFKGSVNSKDNNNDDILSRFKLIEGDFFKSIPAVGADGYIIKNVILNWDDESAATILNNCLQTMKTMVNAKQPKQKIFPRLLIIDTIMPEGPSLSHGDGSVLIQAIITKL